MRMWGGMAWQKSRFRKSKKTRTNATPVGMAKDVCAIVCLARIVALFCVAPALCPRVPLLLCAMALGMLGKQTAHPVVIGAPREGSASLETRTKKGIHYPQSQEQRSRGVCVTRNRGFGKI